MTSAEDLEPHIRDYLRGKLDLDALEDILSQSADEVAASDDMRLRRLHNSSWLKIGEFDEGLIDEERLVSELWSILPSLQVQTWHGLAAGSLPTQTVSIQQDARRPLPLTFTTRRWAQAETAAI